MKTASSWSDTQLEDTLETKDELGSEKGDLQTLDMGELRCFSKPNTV